MRRITLVTLAALLVAPGLALAQSGPAAILAFFENNSTALTINTADGELSPEDIGFGGEIPVGATIVTEQGDFAEIELVPSGSIIKVAESTNFQIQALQGAGGASSSSFRSPAGKFRAVIAKTVGSDLYSFDGQTAVMGVRGTEFVMRNGVGDELFAVLSGNVDVTKAGQTLNVAAGFAVNALAATFEAVQISTDMMAGLLQGLEFQALDPQTVPGGVEPLQQDNQTATAQDDGQQQQQEEPTLEEQAESALMAYLRDLLGMEIGSVTIGNTTYSKAIIQPVFDLGKLRMGLYLPVIYESNIFDPSDYYFPKGNNEWSFGTDQSGDYIAAAGDFLNDLFLKIRFVEYGDNRDPFFFKFGNLSSITVGHGTIMRDFANDADFPAVRRVGLNVGMNGEKVGFEAMVNDAGAPEIFGGRFVFRPIGSLGIGLTGITDIAPAADAEAGSDAETADPWFLNVGADIDLPIIEGDALQIIGFADVAAMFPATRNAITNVPAGFHTAAVFSDQGLRNWGLSSGIFGNIAVMDYRVEFRWYNGSFVPAFYNQMYERTRAAYAGDVLAYLADLETGVPDAGDNVLGVYGEGGFEIEDVLTFEMGYMWPFELLPGGGIGPSDDDLLHLEAALMSGVIPVVPLSGSLTYDRTKFVETFRNPGSLTLFDENTVVKAEVVWEIETNLLLSLLYTTAVARDTLGAVIYGADGTPEMVNQVAINVNVTPF